MSSAMMASGFGFSGIDLVGSNIMKDRNREDVQIAFDRTAAFQERMSNTQWQRGVNDMKAAGLNPMLAYAQGPNTAPTPQMGTPHPSNVGGGFNTSQRWQTAAQIDLMEAEANKANAEAENLRGVTRENIKQQTEESIARIDKTLMEMNKIGQETATSAAQQRNLDEQTRNLRETGVQIRETVNLLRAQQQATGAMQGLSEAQSAEIRQRINANLPRLEAMIKQLEQLTREAALPKQQQDASFYKRTAGTILRNINNTLRNIFGRGN